MTNAVIEASSHALALGRLDGLEPDVAVFTNLTRDHLDFHGTMESYLEAKAILFEKLAPDATAVLNHEDPSSGKLARGTRARILWTGLGEGCDVRVAELERDGRAKLVRTSFGGSAVELGWLLPGRHNLENLASAAGAAFAAGVRPDAIARAASRFRGVPGRLERVDEGQGFGVYVDYAHTPDALERVLGSLRPETEGRLVVLFGCGGDRDRTKRPKMGELAERAADEAIVTSDNPRGEEPMLIIDEILAGARDRSRLRVVPDREEAIGLAVSIARAGDTVLLAGKGHETEQIIGEERRPFDDRLVAARLLRERLARAA
jgi:UDP-N-acetylmuramoyl-L-alanyl-D-glutamate--2,6-diaminopimelate ligase